MRQFVTLINQSADAWYFLVYQLTWQASLLAVLLLVIVLPARRWPAPIRYWLLILALVKFGLPPLLALPTGLFSQMAPVIQQASPEPRPFPSMADASVQAAASTDFLMGIPELDSDAATTPSFKSSISTTSAPAVVTALEGKAWFMLLHLLGSLGVAAWILKNVSTMSKLIHKCVEFPEGEIHQSYLRLAKRIGLRNPPQLLLSHESCGPAAYGVVHPVVILPEAVTFMEPAELDPVLAHELAHHRRYDLWVNWLQLVLTTIWWFNPVLWILNRQIRRLREDCCDDLLLSRQLTTNQAYCETLLSAASKFVHDSTASVSLGFGDRLHPLGRRFQRIMDQTVHRAPRLSRTGILVLIVLGSVLLPGLRRSNRNPPPADSALAMQVASAEADQKKPKFDNNPAAVDPKQKQDSTISQWAEGSTVEGRLLDHLGNPVENAELVLLGEERVIVDGEKPSFYVWEKKELASVSTRTTKDGAFTLHRKKGSADRIGIISKDPLFWLVFRRDLTKDTGLEITLPESGSLSVSYDLPGNASQQPTMIQSKSFDGVTWERDFLRFHSAVLSVDNPGERVLEHLPPGQYSAQRVIMTQTESQSRLMTMGERQLFEVKSGTQVDIRFERKTGRRLTGRVTGLEDSELKYARLTINHLGPEEVLSQDGKRNRMYVAYDVIPIDSEGHFTVDPIPPGKYTASLFAVLQSTPKLSSQSSDFRGELSFTVPEDGESPAITVVAKSVGPRDLSEEKGPRLTVVDEDGKPLSKFEALVYTEEFGSSGWMGGGAGLVFLDGHDRLANKTFDVTVRADGYAPTVVSFSGSQHESLSKGEQSLTLRRGQKAQLHFHLPAGMTWPKDLLPETYFDNFEGRARSLRQPSNRKNFRSDASDVLRLREIGAGQFEFWLGEQSPQFHVAIHSPGYLQFFEAGPFTFADVKNGHIDIDVPQPTGFEVSFEPGDYGGEEPPFKNVSLGAHRMLSGNRLLVVGSHESEGRTARWKVTDLAPGDFSVFVRTQSAVEVPQTGKETIDTGRYTDRKQLTLKPGQVEQVAFRSTPFDPNLFKGDRDAVVRILTPDHKPAAGRQLSVTYYDGHYGSLDVFSGPIPASGEVTLSGITGKSHTSFTKKWAYTVNVDEKRVGTFTFADESTNETFEFTLVPDVGDLAPDVELKNVGTGQSIRLQSLRGQVVFLEFWATWCGPCQEPMMKINALAKEQHSEWKDRVAIVPLSIDAELARVKTHAQGHGWTNLDHYWTGGESGGDFEAPAAKAFVVSGVPTALLIGTDGRILWRGHPLDPTVGLNVKSLIEAALK